MLSESEKQRYDRQMKIQGFGEAGQERLKEARVVIAGTGGLGTPAATYLAAAGVGTLRLIDNDTVDLSNLNRQILHWGKDVGRPKVQSASEKLTAQNIYTKVEPILETIDEDNVSELVAGFDVVVDGTDTIETRLLINHAILALNVPFVHGAVYGFQGRATTVIPGKTACIGCMYRAAMPQEKPPVLGVTPGVIGLIEAAETLKLLLGLGDTLSNRLLVYDGLKMTFDVLTLRRNPKCVYCGTIVD